MNLRERMLEAISKNLNEGVESSKEIINNNIVPSFEEMGMANVEPGEFAQGEITDQENLVNKANMSNDNDFGNSSDAGNSFEKAVEDMTNDLVDISAGDDESSDVASLEIVKTTDHCCKDEEDKHSFGESRLAKYVESILNGKTCEQYLAEKTEYDLKESNYAGPLNFVPDVRISVADVVAALKNKIGEGSEAVHVDQEYDERKDNAYKVSQIDKNLLPKKLHVENVLLELDGDTYKVNKTSDAFPLAR